MLDDAGDPVVDSRPAEMVAAAKARHPAGRSSGENRRADGAAPQPCGEIIPFERPTASRSVSVRPRKQVARKSKVGSAAVLIGLVVALALPVSQLGGKASSATEHLTTSAHGVYTVRPGDTLWSIATRFAPSADPRPMVARLVAETGSDTVMVGERIHLP